MRHRIEITSAARRDLKSLPTAARRRVDRAILTLADDPHAPGSGKLEGFPGFYRLREGDYRIVYLVQRGVLVVVVVAVAHRREIYDLLRRR